MISTIDCVQFLSETEFNQEEFTEKYAKPGVPVLIEGLVSTWPASQKWNAEYLAENWGEREVPIVSMRDGDYANAVVKDTQVKRYLQRIGAIDGVSVEQESLDEDITHYLAQVSLSHYLPELLNDISMPDFFPAEIPGNTVIYAGQSLFSQLHYHPFGSATLSVLQGQKRVRLFTPDQGKYLYPYPMLSGRSHLSMTHHRTPDPKQFPRFSRANYVDITVSSGQMLFIPIYWWHSIDNIGLSISTTSFWKNNWLSRFLPPAGARSAYCYEPFRNIYSMGIGAVRKVRRIIG